MALEMIPSVANVPSSEVSQGTARHTQDGVTKHPHIVRGRLAKQCASWNRQSASPAFEQHRTWPRGFCGLGLGSREKQRLNPWTILLIHGPRPKGTWMWGAVHQRF